MALSSDLLSGIDSPIFSVTYTNSLPRSHKSSATLKSGQMHKTALKWVRFEKQAKRLLADRLGIGFVSQNPSRDPGPMDVPSGRLKR